MSTVKVPSEVPLVSMNRCTPSAEDTVTEDAIQAWG